MCTHTRDIYCVHCDDCCTGSEPVFFSICYNPTTDHCGNDVQYGDAMTVATCLCIYRNATTLDYLGCPFVPAFTFVTVAPPTYVYLLDHLAVFCWIPINLVRLWFPPCRRHTAAPPKTPAWRPAPPPRFCTLTRTPLPVTSAALPGPPQWTCVRWCTPAVPDIVRVVGCSVISPPTQPHYSHCDPWVVCAG